MDKELKSILKLDKMNKSIFFLLIVCSIIVSICTPLILVDFIDIVSEATSRNYLVRYISLYLALTLVEMILDSIFEYYSSMKEFEFTQLLKSMSLDMLFKKNGKFYTEKKTGDLLTVVEDDAAKIASFAYRIYSVIISFVQALAVLTVLIFYDWQLSLLLIMMIPATLIIEKFFGKKLRVIAYENRIDYGNMRSLTEEFVSNAPAMIVYGYHETYMKKFSGLVAKLYRSFKKLTITNELSNQAMQLVTTVGLIIITGFGGLQVFDKKISIGVLVIFLQYCSRFITPFENLILLKVGFNMLMPSLNRVSQIIFVDDKFKIKKEISKIIDIRLENVTFRYTHNKNVLDNLSLHFKNNMKYLIRGESGIGKTTVISLILGLWDATEGKICINNQNIGDIDLESFRRRLSVVSQKTFFLHDTIYNNLSNGKSVSEEIVWNTLKQVGLHDFIKEMENGIHTILGDDGMTISGGQRQRLAIARSILKESDVIIFDEPTSALDSKTEQLVIEMINTINDKIIIIVSHSNCFMDCVNQIYTIEQ